MSADTEATAKANSQEVKAEAHRAAAAQIDTDSNVMYRRLGVSEGATSEEIQAKVKQLRLNPELHPEGPSVADDDERDRRGAAMSRINQAAAILGDEERRKFYDAELAAAREEARRMRAAEQAANTAGAATKKTASQEKASTSTSGPQRPSTNSHGSTSRTSGGSRTNGRGSSQRYATADYGYAGPSWNDNGPGYSASVFETADAISGMYDRYLKYEGVLGSVLGARFSVGSTSGSASKSDSATKPVDVKQFTDAVRSSVQGMAKGTSPKDAALLLSTLIREQYPDLARSVKSESQLNPMHVGLFDRGPDLKPYVDAVTNALQTDGKLSRSAAKNTTRFAFLDAGVEMAEADRSPSDRYMSLDARALTSSRKFAEYSVNFDSRIEQVGERQPSILFSPTRGLSL
jgi:curved DNA-binding protein CbpA